MAVVNSRQTIFEMLLRIRYCVECWEYQDEYDEQSRVSTVCLGQKPNV